MTAPSSRLSSGAVVVRRRGDGLFFLMLRAYRIWDFPKGMVEPGEDPLAAAVREVAEETTLTGLVFPWGEDYFETPPYGRNKVARYYLAESRSGDVELPVSPDLGRPEHHECRWTDYAGALERASPRLEPVVRWAGRRLGIESG
jgi:8-oxo-dGTP pyrophosphatase MutT (NUDIX family)